MEPLDRDEGKGTTGGWSLPSPAIARRAGVEHYRCCIDPRVLGWVGLAGLGCGTGCCAVCTASPRKSLPIAGVCR